MRTWPLALALAACHTGGGDDYAVVPGGPGAFGGGSTIGGLIDASIDGNGDGGTTTQRVCLLTDLRKLTTCAMTGAGGLQVTLGSMTATTADDGSFVMPKPIGSQVTWRVRTVLPTGPQIVTTAMPYSAQSLVPAVTTTVYDDLLHANSVTIIQDQQGSLVIQVVRAGAALVGAKATLTPASQNNTLYDSNSVTVWNPGGVTGVYGVIWAPGVAVGSQGYTITPLTGSAVSASAAIENQTITFVTQEVP